ncbi:MAG: acetylornithine/succinylornithine family transaminase [Oscillospiraceae bacterium]|jgi:acetylornithine/N-succinyldiaminopimelate aminotransferase|nr:acetylornithine/succinylornithine family transaminase [Oscillospiraceae bacterium]
MDIIKTDREYVAGTYARAPLVAISGAGAQITDETGKEFIDLGSGIGVNIFGACDEQWVSAVEAQLHRLQHLSNLYYTEPQAALARLLCEKTGMKKVFFGNSGAEANECAIKCARKYSADKYGPGRSAIITLENSFHGRTLATLTATGQEDMHVHFGPFPEGFKYAPANDLAALEALCDGSVCAVMIELVQGEGGVIPLDGAYVGQIARLCADQDILLIADEVQTGNGRTGTLYAYMQYGVSPDIVSTAKGLGGGLPLGCTLLGAKLENTLSAGTHGSTFGGNPVCAAGALSILSRLDEPLFAEIRRQSTYIKAQLEGAEGVKSVTGLGLMLGVDTEKDAKTIAAQCLEKGVIVLTAKNKVRLLPPLNITRKQLEKAIRILKGVIAE